MQTKFFDERVTITSDRFGKVCLTVEQFQALLACAQIGLGIAEDNDMPCLDDVWQSVKAMDEAMV